MKVGIIGPGKIAEKMAEALIGLKNQGIECYAAASRDFERAQAFADTYGFQKAYGSYIELIQDPEVDLIYIATPHNFHYEQAKLCLEHHKPCLVEKPFTLNHAQADELFHLSRKNQTFITEALWSRYMPARTLINQIIDDGMIGEVRLITADMSYEMSRKERVIKRELAGGALLDIGIYPLSFAYSTARQQPEVIDGFCTYLESGVDATDAIRLIYPDGTVAVLSASMEASSSAAGHISGTSGYIEVTHIGNIDSIKVYNSAGELIKDISIPEQINGYEYEVLACQRSLENNELECAVHTHQDTLNLLLQMDQLRRRWNIIYPDESSDR